MRQLRKDLNGANPVYSPVIALWPIGRMVVPGYPLTYKFSQGIQIIHKAPLHVNDGDLGLVREQQYILRVRLIKEKLFVQFEVSNRCSDNQKLFSVIRDGGRNIMYKICYKKHSK